MENQKYTNKHNLPKGVFDAITADHYTDPTDKPSDYSVSTLISPTQQVILEERYKDELPPLDAISIFNAWVGSVLHDDIEAKWKATMDSFVEKRFYKKISGKVVSGKIDCFETVTERDVDTDEVTRIFKRLIDWKTCRVYKYLKGDYSQWEKQSNLYNYLLDTEGLEADEINIVVIMLDLTKKDSYKKGYPDIPIKIIEIPKWKYEEAEAYALDRVCRLEDGKGMTDEELSEEYPCSRAEQWSSYKDTAILKEGSSRATKVFKCREDAEEYIKDNPKFGESPYTVEDRYTERIRCHEYCSAKTFCKQYAKENPKVEEGLI